MYQKFKLQNQSKWYYTSFNTLSENWSLRMVLQGMFQSLLGVLKYCRYIRSPTLQLPEQIAVASKEIFILKKTQSRSLECNKL